MSDYEVYKMSKIQAKDLEIGQIVFGNPVGEYPCPDFVEALVSSLFNEIDRVYWNVNQKEWDRYESPNLKEIEYRPYCWSGDEEEEAKPNFSYKGVELRWYKHFGRSMTLNVEKSEKWWRKWFDDCLTYIRKSGY